MTDSDESFAFFLVKIFSLFVPKAVVLNEPVLLFALHCRELVVLQ